MGVWDPGFYLEYASKMHNFFFNIFVWPLWLLHTHSGSLSCLWVTEPIIFFLTAESLHVSNIVCLQCSPSPPLLPQTTPYSFFKVSWNSHQQKICLPTLLTVSGLIDAYLGNRENTCLLYQSLCLCFSHHTELHEGRMENSKKINLSKVKLGEEKCTASRTQSGYKTKPLFITFSEIYSSRKWFMKEKLSGLQWNDWDLCYQ